ncbi:MAG TPA: hypothetical protein VGE45_19150 [Chloroflexia bacterium]|jgi:hypothetical protein
MQQAPYYQQPLPTKSPLDTILKVALLVILLPLVICSIYFLSGFGGGFIQGFMEGYKQSTGVAVPTRTAVTQRDSSIVTSQPSPDASTMAPTPINQLYSFSGEGFASSTKAFHLVEGDYKVDWTAYYAGGDGSAEQSKDLVFGMMESQQRDEFGMKVLFSEYIYAGETISGTVPVTTGTGNFKITVGGATDAWTISIKK